MPGVSSFTIDSLGYVWDSSANGGQGGWVKATASSAGGGDASAANQVIGNASLISIDGKLTAPLAVNVGNWPATQPISGNVGVVGAVEIVNDVGNAIPVSGTFFPATQPVSGTVSVGNFPATQPVSAAALPLPTGAATETTLGAVSGKLPATLGQKAMAASMSVAIASDQGAIPTTKQPTGGTNVLKTGTLATSAVTADQVVLTYTVTAAKTLYLTYLLMYGRLTTPAATASVLGAISLESPAGTKLLTVDDMNPTTSELEFNPISFAEPIPFAAGTVVRVVVTPAAITAMTWRANFGGYEK